MEKTKGKEFVPVVGATVLESLPSASLMPCLTAPEVEGSEGTQDVKYGEVTNYPEKKVVVILGKPEGIVSTRYVLVQHKDAFQPILQGLVEAAPEAEVAVGFEGPHAWMDAIVDGEVIDTVRLGFRVRNSHDGAHAINYSFEAEKVHKYTEQVERSQEVKPGDKPRQGGYRYVELVGFRQVCSNGMKVRVPIAEAEKGVKGEGVGKYSIKSVLTEIWQEEQERVRVESLISQHSRVLHLGNPETLIKQQAETVKVVMALANPVKRLIERAQGERIDVTALRTLMQRMFGEAHAKNMVRNADGVETAWDAYNVMTFYASHHKLKNEVVERIENRAADYLVHLGRKEMMPTYLRTEKAQKD